MGRLEDIIDGASYNLTSTTEYYTAALIEELKKMHPSKDHIAIESQCSYHKDVILCLLRRVRQEMESLKSIDARLRERKKKQTNPSLSC